MITTTTNYTINTLPKTKKEIVERLFRDRHIDLDELLELMGEPRVQVNPITLPNPWQPSVIGDYWTVSSTTGTNGSQV